MKVQYKKITIHTPNLMNYDQKAIVFLKRKHTKSYMLQKIKDNNSSKKAILRIVSQL